MIQDYIYKGHQVWAIRLSDVGLLKETLVELVGLSAITMDRGPQDLRPLRIRLELQSGLSNVRRLEGGELDYLVVPTNIPQGAFVLYRGEGLERLPAVPTEPQFQGHITRHYASDVEELLAVGKDMMRVVTRITESKPGLGQLAVEGLSRCIDKTLKVISTKAISE